LDAAYAPAYFELFYYWYFRDVNKAAPYLDSYIANTDQGPEAEYLKTDFLYASGKFAEAKEKALGLITQQGDKAAPRMYKLVAYVCDTLQDMACASKYMTDYFAKQDPDDVVPADYVELAMINSKTPGSEAQAFTNFQKAVDADTSKEGKVKTINQAAALAKKMGDRKQEANWLGVAYTIDPNPSQTDLYNWGMANYQAGAYASADSIFCNVYQTKYPDQIYGYLWCARTKTAKDTTMASEDIVPAYEKLVEMSMKLDSGKYKAQAIQALVTLTTISNDVKKDSKTALSYIDRILQLDPANEFAVKAKPILQKAINRPAQQSTPAKKTGSATTKPAAAKAGAGKK
jgi:tetratricopeptide (TPR) repeat protein